MARIFTSIIWWQLLPAELYTLSELAQTHTHQGSASKPFLEAITEWRRSEEKGVYYIHTEKKMLLNSFKITFILSGKKILSPDWKFNILKFQSGGNLGLRGNSWHNLTMAGNCFSDKKQEVMKGVLRLWISFGFLTSIRYWN